MEKYLDKADEEDIIFRKKLDKKNGKINDGKLFEEELEKEDDEGEDIENEDDLSDVYN